MRGDMFANAVSILLHGARRGFRILGKKPAVANDVSVERHQLGCGLPG